MTFWIAFKTRLQHTANGPCSSEQDWTESLVLSKSIDEHLTSLSGQFRTYCHWLQQTPVVCCWETVPRETVASGGIPARYMSVSKLNNPTSKKRYDPRFEPCEHVPSQCRRILALVPVALSGEDLWWHLCFRNNTPVLNCLLKPFSCGSPLRIFEIRITAGDKNWGSRMKAHWKLTSEWLVRCLFPFLTCKRWLKPLGLWNQVIWPVLWAKPMVNQLGNY